MTAGTKVTNEAPPGKYFTMLLNMADDDLDPFEYRLLGHYIRVCGAGKDGSCFETTRTTAQKTNRCSLPSWIAWRKTSRATLV